MYRHCTYLLTPKSISSNLQPLVSCTHSLAHTMTQTKLLRRLQLTYSDVHTHIDRQTRNTHTQTQTRTSKHKHNYFPSQFKRNQCILLTQLSISSYNFLLLIYPFSSFLVSESIILRNFCRRISSNPFKKELSIRLDVY